MNTKHGKAKKKKAMSELKFYPNRKAQTETRNVLGIVSRGRRGKKIAWNENQDVHEATAREWDIKLIIWIRVEVGGRQGAQQHTIKRYARAANSKRPSSV